MNWVAAHTRQALRAAGVGITAIVVAGCSSPVSEGSATTGTSVAQAATGQAVGPQYDSVHVYLQPGTFDDFVHSWVSTFGGTTSKEAVADVTPTPSQTKSQLILSPVGTLSVFEYLGPTPYPFGAERTGLLLKDFDAGVQQARSSGAALLVAPFNDPIGRDAVVQFPGGVNTQVYWHTTAPSYPPLQTVPDNRVYLSPDSVEAFLQSYTMFTLGAVTRDNPSADGALIGEPSKTFRQIHIASPFGNTLVCVTDGHLTYPYGRDVAGYAVADVAVTLAKAQSAGATVLAPAIHTADGDSAMLQFPGGYIAEVHTAP